MLGNNMFAYCNNSPANFCDPGGNYGIINSNAMARNSGGKSFYSLPKDKYSKTTGMINGQAEFEHAHESFGWGTYAMNGCGAIAVYNAMQLLGKPQALGKIEDTLWLKHGMLGCGLLGVMPWSIDNYFAEQNLLCNGYSTYNEFSKNVYEGAIVIVLIQNDANNVFKGMHYVTAQYTNQEYVIYNIYSDDPNTWTQESLYQTSSYSCYLYGYIIGG